MDLAFYAELAVRLVNTPDDLANGSGGHASTGGLRTLVADYPSLAGGLTAGDLDALRQLRDELRLVFSAATRDDDIVAVAHLNALLARHPIHQQLTRHDGQPWHMHLAESGSAADRYAAAAVAGVTGVVNEFGISRLKVCARADCDRVFIDTGQVGERRHCSEQCIPQASVRPLRASRPRRQRPASTAVGLHR
ncbi:MAG TPA: CGNR zinc finger domain-containing protein [Streptosporangiaceae bacterium]|nr:CGNR zinc finger domain-containing protein [Streptosporangiaceae bacterium]